MFWMNGSRHREPEEPAGPLTFVYVHSHCWMDHDHIIQFKVIEKDQDSEHLFHCTKCDVKEKVKPCPEPCDMLVPA